MWCWLFGHQLEDDPRLYAKRGTTEVYTPWCQRCGWVDPPEITFRG